MTDKNKIDVDAKSLGAGTDLSSDNLEPVELLADDFMRRQRSGEKPTIDEYCEKHPELADEIREVFPALVVIEQVAPATADLAASSRSFTSPDAKPIERIGDYRVLREVGRGGMGVVYEAEQESLGRRVALKVLPRHIAKDEKSLLRFQREARAAARMHHTNIVPVFEVGHDNEYSFYAMQLIKGQGLDHVIDDLRDIRSQHVEAGKRGQADDKNNRERTPGHSIANSLIVGHFSPERIGDSESAVVDEVRSPVEELATPIAEDSSPRPLPPLGDDPALVETIAQMSGSTISAALPGEGDVSSAEDNRRAYFHSVAEIGLQAANALAYAHARGITHRDIKPSNLILDTAGVVWITDFGLARTGDSSMTATGDILGTIRYMSPERFKGQCDNRADVYSLGLTLYEMLVLKPAFESPDRLKLIDIVTKTEVAAPRSIDSRIPRDLETIVLKACDKDPKRRYQSADEMADDIQRFVNDEPILARRASPTERIARWSRRNPWLATAMSVGAAALIAITGISVLAAQTQTALNEELTTANDEQQKANEALAASNKTKEQLIEDLSRSQLRLAEKQAELVAEKGDVAESMLWLARAYELADEPATTNRLLSKLTQASQQMPWLLREHAIETAQKEYALVPYVYGVRNPEGAEEPELIEAMLKGLGRTTFGRQSMAVKSENIFVLQAGRIDPGGNPQVLFRCYDLRTDQWTGKTLFNEGIHQSSAFDEQNRRLATVTYTAKPNLPIAREEDSDTIHATVERLTQVRNIDTGKVVWEHRLRIDSADNPKFVPHVLQQLQTRIAFSSDSQTLLRSAVQKGEPGRFDIEKITIPSGGIAMKSIDCRALAASSGFFTQRMEISQDRKRLQLTGVRRTAFVRNSMQQTEIRSLDFDSEKSIGEPIQVDDALPLYFPGSDQRVAVVRTDGNRRRIQVHDLTSGKQIGKSYELNVPIDTSVALRGVSPDGSRIAVSFVPPSSERARDLDEEKKLIRGWVQVIDLQTNSALAPRLPTQGEASDVVLTDDDRVVVRDSKQLRIWNLGGGKMDRSLVIADASASAVVNLSLPLIQALPDGKLLTTPRFSFATEWDVTTWDMRAGKVIAALKTPVVGHRPLALDRTGRFLLTGVGTKARANTKSPFAADSFEIQSWNLETQASVGPPIQLPSEHVPVAITTDGHHVATVVQPKATPNPLNRGPYRIQIRNLITQETRDLVMPTGRVQPLFVEFDSSGQQLFAISGPNTTLDTFELSKNEISLVDSNPLHGFAAGPPPNGRVTFSNGSWAISGNGSQVAGYRKDGSLKVVIVEDGTTVHSIPLPAVTGSFFPSQLPTSFSRDGSAICFARPGGFVFRSRIPELWSGSPEQIDDRVRLTIGMKLEDDSVEFASLSENESWSAISRDGGPTLEHREFQTIQHVIDEKWMLAEAELQAWLKRRPEDALPLPLLMLCQVEQGKFKEAENLLTLFAQKVGSGTAAEWLKRLADSRRSVDPHTGSTPALEEQSPEDLEKTAWLEAQRIKHTHGKERGQALREWAINLEQQYNLEGAVAALNEAVQIDPDSIPAHRNRFRLLERMGRWEAAIESHRANSRLQPGDLFANYYLTNALLHAGDIPGFKDAWQDFRDRNPGDFKDEADDVWNVLSQRSLLGKPILILGEKDNESYRLALDLVDANYDSKIGMESKKAAWYAMSKGLAEYRRGGSENLEEAIRLLEVEFPALAKRQPPRYWAARGFARFVLAMAHHQLGHFKEAESAYLDGLDWHQHAGHFLRSSSKAPANDWQLAEVIRREAEAFLRIDLDQIDPQFTDTSKWQVILDDNFDEGISQDWQRLDGEWSVVDGAACGTIKPIGVSIPSFGRLERDIPGVPSTFQIEYETWTSDPMVAACFLRQTPRPTGLFDMLRTAVKSDEEQPIGLRIALASAPDPLLTKQGKPDTGINLLTHAPFGFWINKSLPDFEVKASKRYKIRIIRQPQRVTLFVDGKKVMSERVRNIETQNIRFFARGKEGTKMFIDNLRVRIPLENPSVQTDDETPND